jgi:hypothetical protein
MDLTLVLLLSRTIERFGRSANYEPEPINSNHQQLSQQKGLVRSHRIAVLGFCLQFIIIIMKLAFLHMLITVMIVANHGGCHAFQIPSLLQPPLKFFTDSTTATVAEEPNAANKANNL